MSRNGKRDFRAHVKAVNTGNVVKPKDKPGKNNHNKNSQDKSPFNSPWFQNKSNPQENQDNQKRGLFCVL